MSNLDHNEDGLLLANGNGITPSALRERIANDHDHLQHITNSTLSFGQVSWEKGLKTKEEQYLDGTSGIVDELKIRGFGSSTGAASQMN
ncbi:hypothetical protein PPACK8108_LOCUS20967 [Phakopsora pachyrhizi]|uniref:Uncharacterized protein n=1 Tax=Phakopsora pachyrhizi TaxID=170000 RepID=A0AAV0BGB0_PHAPC|nr:hypothetical protein PPACK8108_LOCUS20967 [Phakopsora pachyrhizi]